MFSNVIKLSYNHILNCFLILYSLYSYDHYFRFSPLCSLKIKKKVGELEIQEKFSVQ